MQLLKNYFQFSIFVSFFIAVWLIANRFVAAQLVINEIYPSPSVGEDEWLEIYNTGLEIVDLNTWSVAKNFGSTNEKRDSLASLGQIAPQQKLSFVPNVSKVPLTNSGATIYLLNGDSAVDMINYPALTAKSYARIPDGAAEWKITDATRDASNMPPIDNPADPEIPTTYNHNFVVTEIYSCSQSGEKEWLEIKNSRDQAQDLTAWKLKSQSGVTRVLAATTLPPSGLAILEFSSGLLSDSGGSVALYDPNDEQVWQIDFPACQTKGNSFIWQNSTWLETNQVSKNANNPTLSNNNSSTNNQNNSSNTNSNDTQNNQDNNSSQAENDNQATSPAPILSFKLPSSKIKRLAPKTLASTNFSSGQVLGASTSASNISAHQVSPHFWFLIVGGILLVALPLAYYFIQKAKEQGDLDDTY